MATKRRRRKKRPIPISEIPVIEIISPQINVYGHQPMLSHLADNSYLGGCTCGWQSRTRSRKDNGITSWWGHARAISNGYLLMNGTQGDEASKG